MDRKTAVLAWIALILGVLCLLLSAFCAGFILPNASVSEYSKLAVYVLLSAMFMLFVGIPLAILSLVFGGIALHFCRKDFVFGKERVFAVIGIVGGALVPVLILLCFLIA